MKKVFLLVFILLLISLNSCSSQIIINYEPVGIMDKPLPNIEIGDSIGKNQEVKYFILNNNSLNKLSKYIKVNAKSISNYSIKDYEYGVYKITIYEDGEIKQYLLASREESIVFFEKQLVFFKKDSDLYNEFSLLINRINW